jgi:outer membrane biosynthesis protein TonB
MRIYNGTKSTLTLPFSGGENLTIASKTPSGNVLCSKEFLTMLVTSYNTDEVAIIASGPFELTACANVPTATNYVVQSLDEAIKRFNPVVEEPPKTEKKKSTSKSESKAKKKKVEPVEVVVTEEPKEETPKVEEQPEEKKDEAEKEGE